MPFKSIPPVIYHLLPAVFFDQQFYLFTYISDADIASASSFFLRKDCLIQDLWTCLRLFTDYNVMFQRMWFAFLHSLSVRSLQAFIQEKGRQRGNLIILYNYLKEVVVRRVSVSSRRYQVTGGEKMASSCPRGGLVWKLGLNSKAHTLCRSTYVRARFQMSGCVIIQPPVSYLSRGLQKYFHLNLGAEMWKSGLRTTSRKWSI